MIFQENDTSPFASVSDKCTLSESQLESYLTAEVRYLKRRKLIPRRQCRESEMATSSQCGSGYRNTPGSPNSVHVSFDISTLNRPF